jgi:hypothetical protein
MKQFLALAAAVLVGCSGSIVETPSADVFFGETQIDLTVDSEFSAEQRASIQLGFEFWLAELPELEITTETSNCDQSEFGCFAAVEADSEALELHGEQALGVYRAGAVVLSVALEGEDLALAAAHEFGHLIGLGHGDGIMEEFLSDCSWNVGETATSELEEMGLK